MSEYPRVLYVEDDALSRMVIEILLSANMGLTNVVIFENSQDFERRIDGLPFVPDIILLDIHVKPINGFQMLGILRQHPILQHKPIVALTASVMNEEIDQLKSAGFDGVLAKTIDESSFPGTLFRLLDGNQIWDIT